VDVTTAGNRDLDRDQVPTTLIEQMHIIVRRIISADVVMVTCITLFTDVALPLFIMSGISRISLPNI
jgi:hypothetical protein